MLIGVDTGNRCIKTVNSTFVAGVMEVSAVSPFISDALEFNGKLYSLTDNRVEYLLDKTISEEYFIMTLFGIAKELEVRKRLDEIKAGQRIDIVLGLGLPPRDFARLREKYLSYFVRGEIDFTYHGLVFRINIADAKVYPQAFSAITADYSRIKKIPKAYIVDIGGYTTDVIELRNGSIDPNMCKSFDLGMIKLFTKIRYDIHTQMGIAVDESQVDAILEKKNSVSPAFQPMRPLIEAAASDFVNKIVRSLFEQEVDLRINQGIFVGGGAVRLYPFILKNERISSPEFVPEINANARGYEALLATVCE